MAEKLVNSEANGRRVAFVEQCFGSSGQPLQLPHRVLVGEGVLTKMCRKKPKPRQFFLFNDILVYGNIVISKMKYNKQHVIPLENVKLLSVPDEGNLRNGWQIISPSKSFTVFAVTATEKAEWMAHISKCIKDLLEKHGKRPADVDDSPVWVPDHDAPVCMHCKRSEFSVFNRRHHCRKCGIVCCNACTSKKVRLPQQSSKPLRVCLTCFDKLATQTQKERASFLPNANANDDTSDEDSSDSEEETTGSSGPLLSDTAQHPTFYGGSKK